VRRESGPGPCYDRGRLRRGTRACGPFVPARRIAGQVVALEASGDLAAAAGATSPAAIQRHSLLRYSPALVFLAVVFADSSRFADPDVWGHLRFGQAVLTTGHLPWRDPYAYSAVGLPWVSHEWLSEAIIAGSYDALGVLGLNLMKLGCSAATVVFLALAMSETGASTTAQFGILILAGMRLAPQMQYRPQIFTYAMLSALLALLARDNFRRRAPLWIAVPMFALWANLHGGWVAGLAAVGVYAAVSSAEDWWNGRGLSRGAGLFGIAMLCALATLVTPYGFGTWRTVARTVENPAMLSVINEWNPLLLATVTELRASWGSILYVISIAAIFGGLAAAIALAPCGSDGPLVAIAAMMIAVSFGAVRNVPLGLIAASVPLARHASLAAYPRWRPSRAIAPAGPERASLLNQAIVASIALAITAETGMFSRRLRFESVYPAGAIAFMKQRGLHGNLLCDYGWNDYAIFHCAPASRVFMDSRYEMIYPRRVIEDYLDFDLDRLGAERMLAAYRHDYVLIAPAAAAAQVMSRARGWTLIYQDANSRLYARSEAAAKMTGVPVIGSARDADLP